jgi:hypothetical protein
MSSASTTAAPAQYELLGPVKFGCPLYPRKLPRLTPDGAAALDHKQTHALQYIREGKYGIGRASACRCRRYKVL